MLTPHNGQAPDISFPSRCQRCDRPWSACTCRGSAYPAAVLAASAYRSGVTEQGIRRLFAACDRIGLGLGPDAEAAVLAELAALRAS